MPNRSWIRSRDAALWRNLHAVDAAGVLASSYGPLAAEEALFRALLAERDMDGEGAAFWITVYQRLPGACHRQG